jgi:hypothetical protein
MGQRKRYDSFEVGKRDADDAFVLVRGDLGGSELVLGG